MRYSHVVHPKMRYQYKQWHFMKYMQIKDMQKNKELFIYIYIKTIQKWVIHTTKISYSYIINIQKMSYSYIQKKDLFIQRSYSWKKGVIHIQKKSFLLSWYTKKLVVQKCYIIVTKNELFIPKKVIHTKNEVIHTKNEVIHTKNELFIQQKWIIHILYIQKMSHSYIYIKTI